MSTLFGSGTAAAQTGPDTALRVQTSVIGLARPIVWGTARLAGNLIWYGDFIAQAITSNSSAGGGKGGIFGSPSGTSFVYAASLEIALTEGPATPTGVMWTGKAITSLTNVGFGFFYGDQTQLPWSYLTANHPTQAFAYRLTSYVPGTINLGSSAELPNWTFEVQGAATLSGAGYPDAELTGVVADFLGNANYGVPGWSNAYNADWSYTKGYTIASGLLISYAMTSQQSASSFLDELLTSHNVMPVWSEAVLKLVPRGDQSIVAGAITPSTLVVVIQSVPDGSYDVQAGTAASFVADLGVVNSATLVPLTKVSIPRWAALLPGQYELSPNGFYSFCPLDAGTSVNINFTVAAQGSYNPPTAPVYDLTDADYLPNQNSFGGVNADPVSGQQKPARSQNNVIKVEYFDRTNDYNPSSIQVQDDGAILLYGERGSKGVNSWHWFTSASSAQMAAQLALGREKIANNYALTVRPRFILLEPGDIITLTDVGLGLARQWVRILSIVENQDRTLNLLVEEYLEGTGASPLYGQQASSGSKPNYNADPGQINPPILFEPTDELAGGLEVWAAISGVNQSLYGGCDVYISYNGATGPFARIANGRQYGSARMGALTAALPVIAVNPIGQTIDTVNTLSVNLAESGGVLSSGSQADALALNTACWVDGEVVAYQTATLTGTDAYNLTYLVRGAYGTESSIVNHAIGASFARLDNGILRVPYDQTRIGATIYLKFLPFNIWGVTPNTLADVPAYAYVITGAALASPLPAVTEVRTVFKDQFTEMWWQEISDFRTGIRYIIRKGTSFAGGQDLGSVAHPPFICFGADTYWIMPTCQPVAGLIVYGETAESITIQGNMLTTNIIQTTDFQAAGWIGTYINVGSEGTNPTALLRLTGTGDVLTDPSILTEPDILNLGTLATSGTYTADPSLGLNVGYVADVYLNITWTSAGIPVGTDVLSNPDFLNDPDVLNAAGGQFVDVWIEVRTASASLNDMFSPTDMFNTTDVPDLFNAGVEWGAWQRYVPGVYRAQYIEYRAIFSTTTQNIIAYLTSLVVQASIPARVDHYVGNNVTTAGLTIVFMPDDAILSKPFNGGPLVGGTSNHPLPVVSMSWSGSADANYVIDLLTLSQLTFHMVDHTGTTIAVNGVTTVVEGY
jgi:hypothetical protein